MWVGLEQAVTLRLWNPTVIFFSFPPAFFVATIRDGTWCLSHCLFNLS